MTSTASVTAFFLAAHSQSATVAPVPSSEGPVWSASAPHASSADAPRTPRILWVGRTERR